METNTLATTEMLNRLLSWTRIGFCMEISSFIYFRDVLLLVETFNLLRSAYEDSK